MAFELTMAQLSPSVTAPPGFAAAATINLNTAAAASSPAAAVTAMVSLHPIDVQRLAAQENWRLMYTNHQDSVVSFCVDRAGETIRVNVYYDKAVVGIMFSHPRMGQTQSFRYQVDLSELRKIFRDPRVHTGDGYSNMKKKQKKPNPKSYLTNKYAVGELVNVKGYPDAVISGAPRWPGDMAEIRFADGSD
jgi:hypothetical protein